jgi:LacI family transcriptional regulator
VGLSLEVASFQRTPIEEIIAAAQQHPAAGLVILGTELSAADVEAFSSVKKPLVFLDTYHEFEPFDFVDMNNQDSVFKVVSHLQARGHRQIGMVKGSFQGETRNFRLREEAFVASLARCGLPFDDRFVFPADSTFHGAYDDMLAILRRGAELPTALFCSNDIIACGCLKALTAHGVQVPEEVSLVGFDDIPLAAYFDPPLTTVSIPAYELGRTAGNLLLAQIRGEPVPQRTLLDTELKVRESVGPVAGRPLPPRRTGSLASERS